MFFSHLTKDSSTCSTKVLSLTVGVFSPLLLPGEANTGLDRALYHKKQVSYLLLVIKDFKTLKIITDYLKIYQITT